MFDWNYMSADKITILLIEEDAQDASLIVNHLSTIEEFTINIKRISFLEEAKQYLSNAPASIILIAINDFGSDEIGKIKRIHKIAPDLPIVVLAKSQPNDFILQTVTTDAEDYLLKDNLSKEITLRTIRYAIKHKKSTERLRESERKYKGLVNLLPQTVFEMDVKGNLTFANDLAFQTFGYKHEDFSNDIPAIQLVEEKDRERALSNIQAVLRGEKPTDNEYSMMRKDGTTFPALIFSNPIVKNRTIVGLRGIIFDIKERKQSEAAIMDAQIRYRALYESVNDAILVMDKDIFIDCNPAALKLYGCTNDQLLLQPPYRFSPPAQPDGRVSKEKAEEKINLALAGEPQFFEWLHNRYDETLFNAEVSLNRVKLADKFYLIAMVRDISERKKTEEVLYKSEDKYRNIFNSAPVGIYQSTIDGNFLSVNKRLVQILGYDSKDELMQHNLESDIYYNKEERERNISELESKRNVVDLEICWKKKDGTPIWIQLTAQAITDETGKVQYYEGFVRNVNEQREAELKLRENQKLLSTVIETMPFGIWLIDQSGMIIHGNSAAQKIWGGAKYVGIENYGEYKGWFLNTGKKIEPKEWGGARAILNGESVVNEEIEIESFDGKRKILFHSSIPLFNSRKEITGAIVVNQDITELKRKDSQIRKLSRAVEQSPVLIVITDTSGIIEYVNPKFEQVTGYSFSEAIGRNSRFLKSGYTSKETYGELWRTISSGNEWRGEFHNVCKNGDQYWESAVISPIKNSAGVTTNYLAVKEDISEQKKITAELIAAKERAEHSDNLKTEFLAQMSHEVRTPLNVLLSFSTYIKEVLEERQHLTDDLEQYFSTVSIAGKRIIRTIELILNMSDLKSGSYINDPKPTDIYNEILKDVYHQLHRYADEKKLQFDLIQKSDSLFANVDQFATEQSLIQIIDNAIKFTEKGHVTICAEENETGNPVIIIEDTGVGIGEEYMKMLYSAFTQEDQGYSRSFDGNGLGLALAKKYCDLNNIQIDVKSEKRKGTIFTLTFLS